MGCIEPPDEMLAEVEDGRLTDHAPNTALWLARVAMDCGWIE